MSKEKEKPVISKKIDKLVVQIVEDEEDDLLEEILKEKETTESS
jgi:hypothetical protein